MGLKEKVIDWKNRLKDRHMLTIIVTLIAIIAILAMVFIRNKQNIDKHQRIHTIKLFMN